MFSNEDQRPSSAQWRRLTNFATGVAALITGPAFFGMLLATGWSLLAALLITVVAVVLFRAAVELVMRKAIPAPVLNNDNQWEMDQDVVARRRQWYWRKKFRRGGALLIFCVVVFGGIWLLTGTSPVATVNGALGLAPAVLPMVLMMGLQIPLFFLANIFIMFGPLLFFQISQIKGYEPGDADWGVKLADVRGQDDAKEEIRRVVTLWQSGEQFEKSGGKRERGLMLLGAPGTGKTMLAKAIATGFNSPFVAMPGSGFAAAFMGVDVIVVRYMARKARKLAEKWGGQCIIFIDEIDAVGMRRNALNQGGRYQRPQIEDFAFYGPSGALTASGDVVIESKAWRERLFNERAPRVNTTSTSLANRFSQFIGGGMNGGGGSQALNQLLVVMDGIDDPPLMRRFFTNRINTLLDASFIVPRSIAGHSLRLPRPKPRSEQIFFIGATNVPIEVLDPALTRPGRMGRHIWFRTPGAEDRKDIFDLYITKVDHDRELDRERRREELARMTNGYSPAMIEQVCSMALTYAHADGRGFFSWGDIVEAMTTVESGTAVAVDYPVEDMRAVAVHEAGHAVVSQVLQPNLLATRLSIRKRGDSEGHYQSMEQEERVAHWRHELVARLSMTLGAMAAEHVFYGENAEGVGGDLQSATAIAAGMVGSCGMGPEMITEPARPADAVNSPTIMERYEQIGSRIMQRSSYGDPGHPVAGILSDRSKRSAVAQLLGQAYVHAYRVIAANKEGVAMIAETLLEKRELYGDEVVRLIESARLHDVELDHYAEQVWPQG
jgi:ATP-dependent Zn protease